MASVLHRTTKQYLESVHTPNHDEADWIINPDMSAVAGVPEKYWKITGDTVSEKDASEKATQDATDLPALKQMRYGEIDLGTGTLIAAGFTYDSQTFSLSVAAQTNWNTLKDSESEFTWPVEVSTLDNNAYDLTAANLSAFWTAGKDAIKGHLDSGRALKKSVFDAADTAAVDAVVDSR